MDNQTFKNLWDKHYEPLILISISIVKNLEDAKDIVQESFLKIYNTNYLSVQKTKGTLYVIVRNKCIDLYRKKLRNKRDQEQILYLSKEGYEMDILGAERLAMVLKCIQTLPPRQKKVLLYSLENDSPREICQQLNTNARNISSLKGHGIRLIRTRLNIQLNF